MIPQHIKAFEFGDRILFVGQNKTLDHQIARIFAMRANFNQKHEEAHPVEVQSNVVQLTSRQSGPQNASSGDTSPLMTIVAALAIATFCVVFTTFMGALS